MQSLARWFAFTLGTLLLSGCEVPCRQGQDCPERAPFCVIIDGEDEGVCAETRELPPRGIPREGVDAGGDPRTDGGL